MAKKQLNYEQALKKKRNGDWTLVGLIIKETPDVTRQIIRRPTHKKHEKAKQALIKIVTNRDSLLK